MQRQKTHSQQGNVLFYILIAIALIAVLTYTVMRTGRHGVTIAPEQARIQADTILRYADDLEGGVSNVMGNGTDPANLSFENATVAGYAIVGTVAKNKVFDADGGGVRYAAPDTAWLDTAQSAQALYGQWYFPANVCVPNAGTGDATCATDATDNEDIVAILPYVQKEICLALNRKLNIANCATDDPCDNAGGMWPAADTKFTGTFADGVSVGPAGNQYLRKTAGCLEGGGTASQPAGTYFFYKILLER